MIETELTFDEIRFLKNNEKEVCIESPKGFTKVINYFEKIDDGYEILFDDNTSIKCAKTHRLLIDNDWKTADCFEIGDNCINKYGKIHKRIKRITPLKKQEWIDFSVENEFESYIQNDIIHHNSGKSFIIYLIVRWMEKHKIPTMISVPSTGLVTQMAADFKDYGWEDCDKFLNQIGGDFKGDKTMSKFPITLTTWQSAMHFKEEHFKHIGCIIVDEAHSLGTGEVLTNIVNKAKNCSYRIGMTGTVPKIRTAKFQLLGTLGPVKKVINAKGLIDRGLATDVVINCLYLNYNQNKVQEFHRNHNNKPKYPDEEKFISTDQQRNEVTAKILSKIAKTGNTIGLFSKTAHGELILKNVIKNRTGNDNFELLHKFTPKPIKEAFDVFLKDNNKTFYVNKKIELPDRKKIEKNVSKLSTDEKIKKLFISKIKSLDDINIFFYNGSVDTTTREYIRQKLEVIDNVTHDMIVMEFGDKKIEVAEDYDVPLANGLMKKAKDITGDDDIDDEWIENF